MPINRANYGRNWSKVSRTIRRVARQRCERCGIPNGAIPASGKPVVLTVAHLGAPQATGSGWKPGDKRDTHDVRRENLQALCQRCHLALDQADHLAHAKATRNQKKRLKHQAAGQLASFDLERPESQERSGNQHEHQEEEPHVSLPGQ